MKRCYRSGWLLALTAGFVLACGAAQAGADEKPLKAGKKRIKVIKKVGDHPGFAWYGKKKRGFLGVHLLKLNPELRVHFGAAKDAGVMIAKVEKDSPAGKAGVQVGDILAEVDGEKVASIHQVVKLIGKKKDGHKARLKIFRKGKVHTLTAAIQERERAQVEVSRFVHKLPGGGEEIEFDVDLEHLDDAMEHAHEVLEEFHDGKQGFFKFRHKIESDMEERLKEMEEKIKKLEKKLQGKLQLKGSKRTT